MDVITNILLLAGVIVALYVLIKILAAPIKLIFKLLINAALGFLLLFLANFVGGFFDFYIPLTWISVILAGVGGIPGVILLILIHLLF